MMSHHVVPEIRIISTILHLHLAGFANCFAFVKLVLCIACSEPEMVPYHSFECFWSFQNNHLLNVTENWGTGKM